MYNGTNDLRDTKLSEYGVKLIKRKVSKPQLKSPKADKIMSQILKK